MNRIVFLIVFITYALTGKSQTSELPVISADRPGMATSPFVIKPKSFQIETGFSHENDRRENQLVQTFLYNSTLLRYGLNKNAEIRLQTDYANVKTDSVNITGFNPLTIGTKLLISEGKNLIPKTSFLINLTLPFFGDKNFRPENLTPAFYLLMQNDITERLNICYNIGIEYDGISSAPTEFVALCFSYNMTEKFSGFIENYNWFSNNTKPENFFDCGFAYTIRKNIQLDLSGNVNFQHVKKYSIIGFGFAWNI